MQVLCINIDDEKQFKKKNIYIYTNKSFSFRIFISSKIVTRNL